MNQSKNENKKTKRNGIIRWEAIIPFAIICVVIAAYFNLFFDSHFRNTLEWVGYKAVGSEVNIHKVETSFFNASLRIQGIELTDAEMPTHNSINIGDIRFSMLWDALLRGKVVINEAAIEQIAFGIKRKYPGKVKPPEPVSTEPGLAEKIKEQALLEAQEQAGENVLGDIIALLGGSDSGTQAKKLEESLPSKVLLEKFSTELKNKQQKWDQKLKTLPQGKDIQSLGSRLEKVKTKDFQNPQELQTSLQEIDKIFKEGDSMFRQIQGAHKELNEDLEALDTQYKEIEKQVKADIKTLEQHFRIPKMDAKAISKAIFNNYLSPYKAKFYRYREMADKYMPYVPPNLLKKDKDEDEVVIQPRPREKGITYEFGRLNSYPLFWIKRAGISSKAGATPNSGDVAGEVLNISSNQKITGKPTVLNIKADFPAEGINGITINASLDNTKIKSQVVFKFKINSYPITAMEIVKTPDIQLGFEKANGQFDIHAELIELKNLNLKMTNSFNNISFKVGAKNEVADQIIKNVFSEIPTINLSVTGEGVIPQIGLSLQSNLGSELQKGFEKQIQAKIDEARKRIQAMIDQEIGKQKTQIEAQMAQLKGQADKELKKAQEQLETQKKQAENKIEVAKKEFENQGKKQVEKEVQKAAEELKKRLGL